MRRRRKRRRRRSRRSEGAVLAGYATLQRELAVLYAEADPLSVPGQCHDLAWAHLSAFAVHRMASAALRSQRPSVFQNPLVQDFWGTSAWAQQFLGIVRLLDPSPDVIALPRILRKLRDSCRCITREAYVTHGGVPYEADAAAERILAAGHAGWKDNSGRWFFFDDPSFIDLPDARASQERHARFDLWAGCLPAARSAGDVVRASVFQTLDREIAELRDSDVKRIRDKFIAHAADVESRSPSRPQRPGPKAVEIKLHELRRMMARVFALARILAEMVLSDRYSGPIGALADPARYQAGLLVAPMTDFAAERIGRLPSSMRRLFAGIERYEKRRIESRFA